MNNLNQLSENLRQVDLKDEIVVLDPKFLEFSDETLSNFMQNVSLYYDYYSSKCAKAESIMANLELDAEVEYMKKFAQNKSEGFSDKASDSIAKIDPLIIEINKKLLESKNIHRQLKEYLKAFDKAHEMAQNRGYMLRKEMDKLKTDIYERKLTTEEELDKILNGG